MPSVSLIPPNRAFMSDNMAGAPPEVTRAILSAASGNCPPYGTDEFTQRANLKLRDIFEREIDVFPVSTGTAANCLALAALLPPWGSVLCHQDSHINNDECGAPEALTGGAKLVIVPGKGSKIDPEALKIAVQHKRGDVHSVQPAVLSISQATENGTVYTVDEIHELCQIAKSAGLRVHMDGARFANALEHLGVSAAEITWKAGVDVLSFGFTKNGAMTVDAIVSFDPTIATGLAFRRKRAAQLASKMRFHTCQIDALLTDGLWLKNARKANEMAIRLSNGLASIPGPRLLEQPEANMLFCHLSEKVAEGLVAENFKFYRGRWGPGIVRFVTSFSHSSSDIDDLISAVRCHYKRISVVLK